MKRLISYLSLTLIVFYSLALVGCKDDEETEPTVPQANASGIHQTGTITGKIIDVCTGVPVQNAVVTFGYDGVVGSTVTDISGSFSFANVPVGEYLACPSCSVYAGTYKLTVSLVDYNASQDSTHKKYRNYYYSDVVIKFTNPDSSRFVGLVGDVVLEIGKLNTTLTGQVVDVDMQPVANAEVLLIDMSVIPEIVYKRTVSDVNGHYAFYNVDNGLTIDVIARTADHKFEGQLDYPISLRCNIENEGFISHYDIERVQLKPLDNVAPYVISISPENGADVNTSGFNVVYTFSEPIKQNAYTSIHLSGYSQIGDDIKLTYDGMKKALVPEIPFTLQWAAGNTQLIITPKVDLVGGAKFTLSVATALGKLKDLAGNTCVNNTRITGDFEALKFTTNANTSAPAAPTLGRRVGDIYTSLNYSGGIAGLIWNEVPGAKYFNIYKKVGDGNWQLIKEFLEGRTLDDTTGQLFYGTAASPFQARNVYYAITALSADLVESGFSNVLTYSDDILPTVGTIARSMVSFDDPIYTWDYTINFSEPINIEDAENLGNYVFGNHPGISITKLYAKYYTSGGTYRVVLRTQSNGALPVTYTLTVTNIRDLKGNVMDADSRTNP